MYIDSYSSRGFTVNGNRVLGPCALLPPSVVQWNVSPPACPPRSPPGAGERGFCAKPPPPTQVGSHQEITEESLSLFWMLEPPVGTAGERADVPSPRATPTPTPTPASGQN